MTRIRSVAIALVIAACGGERDLGADLGKADDLDGVETPARTPARIIWLIGDGMGVGQITAAAYAADAPLAMLGIDEVGVTSTHEHEFVTTDSAASATAMASGHKTHFEGVGVVAGTTAADEGLEDLHARTVIDEAQRVDWRTGLVATTSLVDATPAAFAAHRANRRSKDGIAEDLVDAGVDVLIGGGRKFFEGRSDGVDLIGRLRSRGYSVATTATGLRRVATRNDKVVALLAESDMPDVSSGERAMSLAEMTEAAIASLDADNDDGFFLMVEGSWIDRESHELDAAGTIAETLDFDAAVAVALAYARGRDDTLVVVNADHETGGLSVLDAARVADLIAAVGGADAANADTAFPRGETQPAIEGRDVGAGLAPASGSAEMLPAFGFLSTASRPMFSGPSFVYKATHSPTLVPLFAEGPAARFVASARDNAELGIKVRARIAEDGKDGDEPDEPAERPRNLVVVVTDGLGLSGLAALQYAAGAPVSTRLPTAGLVATHAADTLVGAADDAAASLFGAGLLVAAESAGGRTALVTSAAIDEPVLAPIWGGGMAGEASPQTDGLDLVFAGGGDAVDSTAEAAWIDRGAVIERRWARTVGDRSRPLVRLIAADRLAPASDRLDPGTAEPSLGEMTEIALDRLSGGEPFVLVVHAAGLDDRLAELDRGGALVDEIADFDGAVAAAAAFAAREGDTAVVAVSLRDSSLTILDNHYGFHKGHCGAAVRCGGAELFAGLPVAAAGVSGTGGFSEVALQGDFADLSVLLQYSWLAHQSGGSAASANFVPLFATGPGTEALAGFRHLSDVGAVLRGWVAP
jgi:alkaline phosphatase